MVDYSAYHWAKKAEEWAAQAAGVSSVNGRTGTVTIISADVTGALGYTPYNSSNPNGYTSNVGTVTSVNNTSPDADGNVTITIPDPLPGQTGQNGKYLTTNGTSASWAAVDTLPTQSGQSGKYLTTNGTSASWANISIPTVNDATLTIQQNGTTVDTFTANSSTNKTINIKTEQFKLFHYDWFDYELNDQSWLRADTFSWQDGTVYSDAYNHLVADNSGGTSQTETVGSYTITYKLASDGHKITTDETNVANIYNESGVAWYYILDTTNQRFKLPRTKYGFVGLRDTVGKYVPESLPNILGTLDTAGSVGGSQRSSTSDGTGALSSLRTNSAFNAGAGGTASYTTGISFDASASSSVYQTDAPVQQASTQMYLYFYVGQFSQTATEQTAGLNSELFNGKMDRDMSNMNASATAKETIVGWGMPDYSAGVSKSWNTSIQADKDGWVCVEGGTNSSQTNSYKISVSKNGSDWIKAAQLYTATAYGAGASLIPIPKGYYYKAEDGSNSHALTFYPCIGV